MRTKPRSDSVLKTLPADRQADIAEYARDHSLQDTVAWLKADGVKTSRSSLSEFLLSLSFKQEVRENENVVATLLAEMTRDNPDMDPAVLESLGQMFFTALAMKHKDPDTWVAMQQLALKKNQLALDRNKFEFDAAAACMQKLPELKAIASNKELSEDQKLEQARLALFGSAPQ